MEVLVPLGDGVKGGRILWGKLQGPARSDPGEPALPHDIQRGGRLGALDICIRGDRNRGGSGTRNRRFSKGHQMAGIIILC